MQTKYEVLSALLDSKGGYVSGEALASGIGCSRMAICKAVKSLQEDGFSIESSKGKGYTIHDSDILSQEYLDLLFKGICPVFFYSEIGSTNTEAKVLLGNGHVPPFAVIAEKQTGGKGRLGRTFVSPEGGIYFSLVLPGKSVPDPDLVTTGASLAVSEAMERLTGIETRIKWVNDLYIGDRKCTGILTEGIVNMEEGGLSDVIIGIGVNLRTRAEDYPEELRSIVTSFFPDGNSDVTRAEALRECISSVLAIQGRPFLDEYRRRCFLIGRDLYRVKGDDRRACTALDIDGRGHLVVRYEDGSVEALSSGEVTLRV